MSDQTDDLQAKPAVLQMTLQIKRAATGRVEEFTLIGTPSPAQQAPQRTNDEETKE